MAGLMDDVEKVKFVYGSDSPVKMKQRIELLEKVRDLDIKIRAEIICVLYSYQKKELNDLIIDYIDKNFPQFAGGKIPQLFEVWYQGIINREKRDLKIVLRRLAQ